MRLCQGMSGRAGTPWYRFGSISWSQCTCIVSKLGRPHVQSEVPSWIFTCRNNQIVAQISTPQLHKAYMYIRTCRMYNRYILGLACSTSGPRARIYGLPTNSNWERYACTWIVQLRWPSSTCVRVYIQLVVWKFSIDYNERSVTIISG